MRTLTILLSILVAHTLSFSQAPQLHGIDVADIDRAIDPCADFYGFADGAWRAKNPIPASMTRWSKRWQAGESSKEKLRTLLEAAEANEGAPKGSADRLIGDYYGACIDEPRVNARGVDPLKPWFAKIDGVTDVAGLERVLFELHDAGIAVPFGLYGQQDPHNPGLVLADIGANGFAMPDRDYYLKPDARFKERGACVVDQFDHYEIDGGIHHNGKLVLGESIGDLRGDAIRPEQQRLMVQTDPHPIAKYRVIGPLANLPEFRTVFSCAADAPMVRPADKRCEVW